MRFIVALCWMKVVWAILVSKIQRLQLSEYYLLVYLLKVLTFVVIYFSLYLLFIHFVAVVTFIYSLTLFIVRGPRFDMNGQSRQVCYHGLTEDKKLTRKSTCAVSLRVSKGIGNPIGSRKGEMVGLWLHSWVAIIAYHKVIHLQVCHLHIKTNNGTLGDQTSNFLLTITNVVQ